MFKVLGLSSLVGYVAEKIRGHQETVLVQAVIRTAGLLSLLAVRVFV